MLAELVPSRGCRGESVSLPFLAFRGCPHPWFVVPFLRRPSQQWLVDSFSWRNLSDSDISPSLFPHLRPLWLHWAHQDNSGTSLHLKVSRVAAFLPSATLILPCHLTQFIYRFRGLGRGYLWGLGQGVLFCQTVNIFGFADNTISKLHDSHLPHTKPSKRTGLAEWFLFLFSSLSFSWKISNTHKSRPVQRFPSGSGFSIFFHTLLYLTNCLHFANIYYSCNQERKKTTKK